MIIQWMPLASEQLEEIALYISYDSAEAAGRIVQRTEAAVERLAKFPLMGRAGGVKHTRELVVAGTNYVVPYRTTGDVIEILGMFHGNQRFPKGF